MFIRPTNDMTYLMGNEGQNVCEIFSVTTAFVSYGVKQELTSQYANECWLISSRLPLFFALEVSEATCRIREKQKNYLLAGGMREPARTRLLVSDSLGKER